jgi:hypothetical protein
MRIHSLERQYMRMLFIPIFSGNGPGNGSRKNVKVLAHRRKLSGMKTLSAQHAERANL